MSTIRELVGEGDPCGKFKLTRDGWGDPLDWFCPFYVDEGGLYYGRGSYTTSCRQPNSYRDWRLWTEPKPKVKRWLWRKIYAPNEVGCFEDTGDVARAWQKIPGTEVEMDE